MSSGASTGAFRSGAATHAIYQALRDGTWIPGQRQRLQQPAPGTWDQALAGVPGGSPGRQDDDPGHRRDRHIPRRRLAHRTQPPGAQRQPPRRVLTVSRSPLIAVAAAGLLSPQRFGRRRPQPGYRSGDDQG